MQQCNGCGAAHTQYIGKYMYCSKWVWGWIELLELWDPHPKLIQNETAYDPVYVPLHPCTVPKDNKKPKVDVEMLVVLDRVVPS
jgi:hypothetical protein